MNGKTPVVLLVLGISLLLIGSGGLVNSSRSTASPNTAALIQPPSARQIPIITAVSAANPSPASPQATLAQEQAVITQQLRSSKPEDRQDALGKIRALSKTDPSKLALGLAQWAQPLLDEKQYQDVETIFLQAINARPFDVTVVTTAQHARVTALLADGKYAEALIEAKSYYNVALLKDTGEAVDLISQVLAKAGDPASASQFRTEQISFARTGNLATDGKPNAPSGVLKSISVGAAPYAGALTALMGRQNGQGGYSNTNLMGQGNLLLLSDQPSDAKAYFEAACKSSTKPKDIREALEGIARAIRAIDGNVAQANAYIESVRSDPSADAAITGAGSPPAANVRDAAQNTILADVGIMAVPPLEKERQHDEAADGDLATPIQITSGFECSTPITVKKLSPTHFEVSVDTPFTDWFMFHVQGVAGKTVRIDLTGKNVDIQKWTTLNPVYSYVTDLDDPASYSASDPFNTQLTTAWNGAILPNTDGQKWHYISDAWRETSDALSFVQRFDSDGAFIAMRVPYAPGYNDTYLRELSSHPFAKVVSIGRTIRGRRLQLVEIGGAQASSQQHKPCVLIYAREHADEQDSSWVAQGAITYLLGDGAEVRQLRDRLTFLVIPVFDPDTAVAGEHEYLIGRFLTATRNQESLEYAQWFQHWVDDGNRLDLVFDLHNLQSTEGGDVACAQLESLGIRGSGSLRLHNLILAQFFANGFTATRQPWEFGWSPDRLGGWLARRFGPIALHYELNSQAPDRHLNLARLKSIGRLFVEASTEFLRAPEGKAVLRNVDARRTMRSAELTKFGSHPTISDPITFESSLSKVVVGNAVTETETETEIWVP